MADDDTGADTTDNAESGSAESGSAETSGAETSSAGDVAEAAAPAAKSRPRRRLRLSSVRRAITRTRVAATLVVIVAAALAVSTYLGVRAVSADNDLATLDAQYRGAARTGVTNLISVDANRADKDVDRILAGATGEFRSDFAARSADFINVVRQLKVTSKGTVNEVGLESSSESQAVALVSATSTVTNESGAQEEPRVWRLRVHLTRKDGTTLISKVEYAV